MSGPASGAGPEGEPAPHASEGFDFARDGVLVAGGTSGVGLATAQSFVRAGCRRVALVGRDATRGESAVARVREIAPEVTVVFVAADLNDPDAAQQAADAAVSRLGSVDVLVNSVVSPYQPRLLHETNLTDLRDVLAGQALGPMLMTRALLPHLRERRRGSVVTLASDAAKVPTPGETGIGAAMAALVMFCQTLAVEAKRDNIRVNVLTPSLIADTPGYDRAMAEEFSKRIFDKIVRQAQLGLTTPGDLANAVLFLASPLARRITGQVISVNGGISVS